MREITSLEELKSIELDIMKKIHAFCVEKGIVYYLAYGSLLGAVRHGGFIPWDDDIDINMCRKDYTRFCKEFPKYAKENGLALVNYSTEIFFPRAYSKVINTDTVLIETDYRMGNTLGVFVDIWPLDNAPNSYLGGKLFAFSCDMQRYALNLMVSKSLNSFRFSKGKKMLIAIPYLFLSRLSQNSVKKYVARMDRCFSRYAEKKTRKVKCTTALCDAIPITAYGTPNLIKFEDASFFAPYDSDLILKKRYGDYMKLPPMEEQIPHHVMDVFWNTDEKESI